MNTQPMIELENFPDEQFTGTPISVSENSVIIEFRGKQIKATKTEAGWKVARQRILPEFDAEKRLQYNKKWKYEVYWKKGVYLDCITNEIVMFPTANEALKAGMTLVVLEESQRRFRVLIREQMRNKSPNARDFFQLGVNFEKHVAIYKPGEKP